MINIALYISSENQLNKSEIPNANITEFCSFPSSKSIHIKTSNKNKLSFLKEYYKKEPFMLLFDNEKVSTELPKTFSGTHICLIIKEFIIKTQRIFNLSHKKIEKIMIKSEQKNLFYFDDEWEKTVNNDENLNKKLSFLFGKEIKEEHLYVYYKIIKELIRQETNLNTAQEYINYIFQLYPNFIELAVLVGSYFYDKNNLYTALSYFERAKNISTTRSLYDALPMIPKYHKTVLDQLIESTKYLIKKYDQAH